MKIQKEYWIGCDGVNSREPWVMTSRPSGISGGGSNQSIHVIQYSEFNKFKKALENIVNEAFTAGEMFAFANKALTEFNQAVTGGTKNEKEK